MVHGGGVELTGCCGAFLRGAAPCLPLPGCRVEGSHTRILTLHRASATVDGRLVATLWARVSPDRWQGSASDAGEVGVDLMTRQPWSLTLQASALTPVAGTSTDDLYTDGANFTWWVRDGS